MTLMLHAFRGRITSAAKPPYLSNPATYRTNPNPPEHSKSHQPRLTLVMLSILRVPPMVRTAFLVLLLGTFLAASAAAARINAVQSPAHASINRNLAHRAHHPAHSIAHTTRPARTPAHSLRSGSRTAAHATAGHRAQSSHSSSHAATYTATHRSSVRRARYTSHTVPAHLRRVAVHAEPRETSPERDFDAPHVSSLPSSAPSSESEPALRAASEPDSTEAPAVAMAAPPETGVTPVPAEDPTTRAVGNPLFSTSIADHPALSSDQIAELRAPQILTPRIDSYTLRGNHDSLVRQNERSELEDLERIEDDADLQDRIARGMLVRVPESSALFVNPALPDDRRYCRPWTADFLSDLSRAHQYQFHKPLIVSSAVRTVEYQKHLMRVNRNAAEAEGDIVSPHVTGATVDIAKSGLSRTEMLWMRNQLLKYQNAGVIDVEEEFRQRCFHITVYREYDSLSQVHRPASAPAGPAIPAGSAGSSKDE